LLSRLLIISDDMFGARQSDMLLLQPTHPISHIHTYNFQSSYAGRCQPLLASMSGDRLANQQGTRPTVNAHTNEKLANVEGRADSLSSVGMESRVRSTSSQGTQSAPSRNSSIDMDKMTRPKRKRISPQQLQSLLAIFSQTDTPSYELRDSVGAELGMSNREVQVRSGVSI
jgi:hypothetical protein